MTEIHTDISIFNENIEKVKYLQYRDNFQNFQFREEEDYLDGKEFCVTQLKLDDTIIIQKRTYTKLSEVFSQVGGYMQLMNTVFSLLALIINKYRNEVKILNSIFNFNIKEKKMSLKFRSLEPDSISHLTSNKNLIFSSKKSLRNFNNIEFDYNKSKNKLNLVDNNNCSRISSVLNISENKNVINDNLSRGKISRNTNNAKNIEFFMRSIKSNESFPKLNFNINSKDLKNSTVVVFKENININLFDILCNAKNSKKKLDIELFKLGDSFYRKRMDIVHVFTLLLITEKVLITNDDRSNLLSLNLHK